MVKNRHASGNVKALYVCIWLYQVRLLKKITIYTLASVAAMAALLLLLVYLFRDELIQRFVEEANKSLNTPVSVGKVTVSPFEDFPNVSLVFSDVYIEDSHPAQQPLFTASRISFSLNALEAWRGIYTIRQVRIRNSEIFLRINAEGKNNYTILKNNNASGHTVRFDLENVIIIQTRFEYKDEQTRQHHVLSSEKLLASIGRQADTYAISARGQVVTEKIGVRYADLLVRKQFDVAAEVLYDDQRKLVTFQPSSLQLTKSVFDVSGTFGFADENRIDLAVNGTNTTLGTLLSLLPEEQAHVWRAYESEGEVYFNLTMKGEMSARKDPITTIAFGCRQAQLKHPDYGAQITELSLEGSFATPSLASAKEARLFLKNMEGKLNGKLFTAALSILDLEQPTIDFTFKGELDAASVFELYPLAGIKKMDGTLAADVSLRGDLQLLRSKETAQQLATRGTLQLAGLTLTGESEKTTFENLSGTLQFDRNDIAVSNLVGKWAGSNFQLNGILKNGVGYLLLANQPLGIEMDAAADFIDLNRVMPLNASPGDSAGGWPSSKISMNANATIGAMRYQRFFASQVKGDLLIKNRVAVSRMLQMNTMGGAVTINGIADGQDGHGLQIAAGLDVVRLHADSIFYVFKDFDQQFIQSHHLQGLVTAAVNLELALSDKFVLLPASLVADVSATIAQGQLIRFEPLQQLKKFLDDEGLARVQFAELKNDIHIENQTVYIPQMEIKTNVTQIQLSGTHTFDQHIDYRLVAPLRNKSKIDPDEAFGAIEQDGQGKTKIFLKITGTTDNYQVAYDRQATRKKIAGDMKKEVQELRDAFRKKTQKKKALELEKDDYFDWDN